MNVSAYGFNPSVALGRNSALHSALSAERSVALPRAKEAASTTKSSEPNAFSEMLNDVMSSEKTADQAVKDYAAGKTENLHETMVAVAKADIQFRMLASVRNKLVAAYQQVSQMR